MNTKQNRLISLAGIFQAAALVQQIAWFGKFDQNNSLALIESLFSLESESINDIYKNIEYLQYGLETFIRVFEANNRFKKDQEISRYALSLVHIERCLLKRQDLINLIKQGIIRTQKQTQHFPLLHDNIIANLAGIYTDTVSTLNFRIHITGEQIYLNNINNSNKIRALLLTGVRAAVLWRQIGGNRLQLLFCRKQIINDAKMLLNKIQKH